jgi:uncharacterized membrane protein (UPF0127 family)
MKIVERIVIVLLLFAMFVGAAWLYLSFQYQQAEVREAVARGEYEIPKPPSQISEATGDAQNAEQTTSTTPATDDDWKKYYPKLVPILIGTTTVQASIADSLPERIKGLSDTPYLPEGIVKLFAFGTEGEHSIWMKDMNYAIDIIWVAKAGQIVHIKNNVSPETYPESFASPKPAWYVIETPAGFVEKSGIDVGDEVVIPQ